MRTAVSRASRGLNFWDPVEWADFYTHVPFPPASKLSRRNRIEIEISRWLLGLVLVAFLVASNSGASAADSDPRELLSSLLERKQSGEDVDYELGVCLLQGYGTSRDFLKAIPYLSASAEKGHGEAQTRLAQLYFFGNGVEKSVEKALEWYAKAAAQNHEVAQQALGTIFRFGDGVGKNPEAARDWFTKAAKLGYSPAQRQLGQMLKFGEGGDQDLKAALAWLTLAGSSTEAGELRKSLSAVNLAEAEKIIAGFAPTKKATTEFRPTPLGANPTAPVPTPPATRTQPISSGTAFAVTEDGYMITNFHVVEGASRVQIRTQRGLVEARVVKIDPANDLALIKVDAQFKPLVVTSSRGVKLGETVATVGFPNVELQGLSPKLTKGEISSLAGIQDDPRHFQISAPVQPGNSGGALVNLSGQVIGVVVARLSERAAIKSTGSLPQNVNYAVKSTFLAGFLESVPQVAAKLVEPTGAKERPITEVAKELEAASVIILAY